MHNVEISGSLTSYSAFWFTSKAQRLRTDNSQSSTACDCTQAALECEAKRRSGRTQDLAQGCYKGMMPAWNVSGRQRQWSLLLSFALLVYAGSTGPFLLLKDDCVQHLRALQIFAEPHQCVCTEQSFATVLLGLVKLVCKYDALLAQARLLCERRKQSCKSSELEGMHTVHLTVLFLLHHVQAHQQSGVMEGWLFRPSEDTCMCCGVGVISRQTQSAANQQVQKRHEHDQTSNHKISSHALCNWCSLCAFGHAFPCLLQVSLYSMPISGQQELTVLWETAAG